MRNRIQPLLTLLLLSAMTAVPRAVALNIGDKPELSGKSGKGEVIDLKKFIGKIVIVDFWATWCEPCLEEAPHLVAIHRKYSAEGLEIIGVSLDGDLQAMMAVAREKGFEWPLICDGKAWKSPHPIAWDIDGLPATFLIGPDGSVLWMGRPKDGLDEAIVKAFKEHPPVRADPKTATGRSEADEKEKKATALLDEADGYKSAGKTGQAKKKYQEVIEQYPGTPQAASAKKALAE